MRGKPWNTLSDEPGVKLDGSNRSFSGLRINVPNCEVSGLFLTNFSTAADVRSAHSIIGGSSQGQRNVISGNSDYGVLLYGHTAHHNVVQGNRIGLDVSGEDKLPNDIGVHIGGGAYANTVGGDTIGEHNAIIANSIRHNGFAGIDLMNGGNTSRRAGHHHSNHQRSLRDRLRRVHRSPVLRHRRRGRDLRGFCRRRRGGALAL